MKNSVHILLCAGPVISFKKLAGQPIIKVVQNEKRTDFIKYGEKTLSSPLPRPIPLPAPPPPPPSRLLVLLLHLFIQWGRMSERVFFLFFFFFSVYSGFQMQKSVPSLFFFFCVFWFSDAEISSESPGPLRSSGVGYGSADDQQFHGQPTAV